MLHIMSYVSYESSHYKIDIHSTPGKIPMTTQIKNDPLHRDNFKS